MGSSNMLRTESAAHTGPLWDQVETMPRKNLRQLQLERLRQVVSRVAHLPFYANAFEERKLSPDKLSDLADIEALPFTTKEDLRDHYPLGFLAVPRSCVARYHGSSGTTGVPTFVAYTRTDLETWADLCARFLAAGSLLPEHTVHVAFGYGLFTGGFGLHYGIERIGAAIVPAASGNTRRQVLLLRDLQAEVLVCTPSYALNIADVCRAESVDPRSLHLKYGHFGGEPWTEDMRAEIEDAFGIEAYNNYGLSEVLGPGVSGECCMRSGMHIQEDHLLVECVDPETLRPVPDGEYGELVFTTLTKEAMPLLRYRTRDIAALDACPCPCGRTTVRMSRVVGRTDDMIIIRGVNVFPTQVEEALLRVEGTAPHYLIEINRPGALDEASVKVEVRPEHFSDRMREMQALREAIAKEIESNTGIRMAVELVPPNAIERSSGKARRVLDHRASQQTAAPN